MIRTKTTLLIKSNIFISYLHSIVGEWALLQVFQVISPSYCY